MGALRFPASGLALLALAGCGGDASPPRLADGSALGNVPTALAHLDDAVMTRAAVKRESDLEQSEYRACGVPTDGPDRTVVERTGLHGSSLTIESGSALYGCDKIPEPLTAKDPDRPYGGIWCASPDGRLNGGALSDPRLSLCPNARNEITAFAWVQPGPDTAWVVVSDAGRREIYEAAEALPVRITTTDRADPAGSASFEVEEYGAAGAKLQEYTLDVVVAG